MAALALQGPVAVPVERHVQEWKLAEIVEAGEKPRPCVFQHITGRCVLAQINSKIEAVRPQLFLERDEIVVLKLSLAKLGSGMEEVKRNELADRRLEGCEGTRGVARQNRNGGLREDLLQAPDRLQRGHKVADVVQLDHKDTFDFLSVEQWRPGQDPLHRLVVRSVVVGMT